jgi:hypothetical protein
VVLDRKTTRQSSCSPTEPRLRCTVVPWACSTERPEVHRKTPDWPAVNGIRREASKRKASEIGISPRALWRAVASQFGPGTEGMMRGACAPSEARWCWRTMVIRSGVPSWWCCDVENRETKMRGWKEGKTGSASTSYGYGFMLTILAAAVALLVDDGSSMPSSASSTTTASYWESRIAAG